LNTNSLVKIINRTSKNFGRTGKIVNIKETSGMVLNRGRTRGGTGLITYVDVRLDDTENIVTLSNLTGPLDQQLQSFQ
jgi:hypothetical protein